LDPIVIDTDSDTDTDPEKTPLSRPGRVGGNQVRKREDQNPGRRAGRQQGYALLTTMFVTVSFLCLAMMLFHPLGLEAGKDGDLHLADRNLHRYKQALFGPAADQCATTLVHYRGLYGDYPSSGGSGRDSFRYDPRLWSRTYGTTRTRDQEKGGIEVPQPYRFGADHFWSGYRGKGYIAILPADRWNGDTYGLEDGLASDEHPYHPVWGPFCQPRLSAGCGASVTPIKHSDAANYAGSKRLSVSFQYFAPEKIAVALKDFSPDRNTHALRLVLAGACNDRDNMYFEPAAGYPDIHADHRLYLFEQHLMGGLGFLSQNSGQKKLLIQVRTSPGAPWVTRDTRVMVFSPSEYENHRPRYRVNFYG